MTVLLSVVAECARNDLGTLVAVKETLVKECCGSNLRTMIPGVHQGVEAEGKSHPLQDCLI
jgi:hypothetical protein